MNAKKNAFWLLIYSSLKVYQISKTKTRQTKQIKNINVFVMFSFNLKTTFYYLSIPSRDNTPF